MQVNLSYVRNKIALNSVVTVVHHTEGDHTKGIEVDYLSKQEHYRVYCRCNSQQQDKFFFMLEHAVIYYNKLEIKEN